MATKPARAQYAPSPFFRLVSNSIEHLLAAFSAFFIYRQQEPVPPTPLSIPQRAPILTPAMVATRATPFKAYDLRRKKLHTIEGSGGKPAPRKTSIHRLTRSDWAVPRVTKTAPRKGAKKTTTARAAPVSAAALLRCDDDETSCQHCGRAADDPACSSKCYSAFRKAHDASDLIEIRGPGKHGYGAYTKPTSSLRKAQWLGEYVGALLPLGIASSSLYRFEIPGVCAIDAEPCGNWTRFVNSSCAPNVAAFTDTVGKRHAVLFQALRDIGPGEELTFNYGRGYFEAAGMLCACKAMKRPHVPGAAKARKPVKGETAKARKPVKGETAKEK